MIESYENKNNTFAGNDTANDDRERQMRLDGYERSKKRREQVEKQSGLSATTAGNAMKEETILGVANALDSFVDAEAVRKGGRRPKWYNTILMRNKQVQIGTKMKTIKVPAMDVERMANVALTVCQDAISRNWGLNATAQNAGMSFHTELFGHLLLATGPEGRRIANDIDKFARKKTQLPEQRRRYAENYAESKGYSFDPLSAEEYRDIGGFLLSGVFKGCNLFYHEDVQLFMQDWPERKMCLTDEAQDVLDKKNEFLDWLYPRFGPMVCPPIHGQKMGKNHTTTQL